jgi:hypothetical protein
LSCTHVPIWKLSGSITNIVTCPSCHHEIPEETTWTGIVRWGRKCLFCGSLLLSAFSPGQLSPPDKGPPIMINVLSPSMYENASPRTVTYSSSELVPDRRSVSHQHWRLSKADFQLSPADKARLRSRRP